MIVFSGCHLRCSFCYTPETSQAWEGTDLTPEQFQQLTLDLKTRGAQNLNLITPSHLWSEIETLLDQPLPVVLKVTGYESPRLIERMAQVTRHFVFDFKALQPEVLREVNLPTDYAAVATRAVSRAMELNIPSTIRHLLMPRHLQDSEQIIDALAELSYSGRINLMTRFSDSGRLLRAPESDVQNLLRRGQTHHLRMAVDGKEIHESIAA